MRHHKSFAYFPDKYSILALTLESFFIILNGLLWLLDIHEGSCHQLEVFNGALCIQNFEVTPSVVVSVFQLIEVDLSLLLLCLDEASVGWLDLFEHVEGLLGIAHLEGKVRLSKHNTDCFRGFSELTDRSC